MSHAARRCFSPPAPARPPWQRCIPARLANKRSIIQEPSPARVTAKDSRCKTREDSESEARKHRALNSRSDSPASELSLSSSRDENSDRDDSDGSSYVPSVSGRFRTPHLREDNPCYFQTSERSHTPAQRSTIDMEHQAPPSVRHATSRPPHDLTFTRGRSRGRESADGYVSSREPKEQDSCSDENGAHSKAPPRASSAPRNVKLQAAFTLAGLSSRGAPPTLDLPRGIEIDDEGETGEPCEPEDTMQASDVEAPCSIPKPPGQVTTVPKGGYLLLEVLNWEVSVYKDFQNQVAAHANDYLDLSKTYAKQDPHSVQFVCDLMCDQNDDLRRYENGWPIRDCLKMFLQTSARTPVQRKRRPRSRGRP